ncbi:hypothetical protein Taro_010986, partial [Colocasia esculenta]|nr:hypothetical protein [Colocasia esculenta]
LQPPSTSSTLAATVDVVTAQEVAVVDVITATVGTRRRCRLPIIGKPLVGALSFHQFFEGLGLGSCIVQVSGAYSVNATWSAVTFLFPGLRGGVIMELGARRRWSFQCEGLNGLALLLEVRLLSSGKVRAGRRRRGVVIVLVASSGSPSLLYVTLGVCP